MQRLILALNAMLVLHPAAFADCGTIIAWIANKPTSANAKITAASAHNSVSSSSNQSSAMVVLKFHRAMQPENDYV